MISWGRKWGDLLRKSDKMAATRGAYGATGDEHKLAGAVGLSLSATPRSDSGWRKVVGRAITYDGGDIGGLMGRQVIPDDTSMIVVSLRNGVLLDVSQHCVDEIPKNKLVAIHLQNMNPPTRTLNGTIDIRRKEGVARFDTEDHIYLGLAPCVVSWVAYPGCRVSPSIFCIY